MPTPDGIRIEPLDQRTVSQKRRRLREQLPQQLGDIPHEWRDLLCLWVKRGGNSRWETLAKDAGSNQVALAESLREWLLREGWATVVEQRKHGGWWPLRLELRNLPALRFALGLADHDDEARRWEIARAELELICGEMLSPALLVLDEIPVARALARHDLLTALRRWRDAQQSGTHRDFALFARGGTKDITEAEWRWLEETLDLAEFGIERHTPLLLLSAPLLLTLADKQLDVSASPDFAALTPTTLAALTRASGQLSHWLLVENRTSFERAARTRASDTGVIWLPGFPPNWWREAIARLLAHAPAPALIACDPDPAGIVIALSAARLWQTCGLEWQPWKMAAADLAALTTRKTLTGHDRQLLATLETDVIALPASLAELAAWMAEHGEKGEQEGYL